MQNANFDGISRGGASVATGAAVAAGPQADSKIIKTDKTNITGRNLCANVRNFMTFSSEVE
jgi:hypothetical protein